MYQLEGFIPYDGEVTSGEHKVLVWSQRTGYYFTQFGFIMDFNDVKIVAKEDDKCISH